MKNKILYILIASIIGFNAEVNAQLNIQASVIPATVCAGGSVFLMSTGGQLMNTDFNNGMIGTGWSSTAANPVFNNPCGPGPVGFHLWVGTTASAQRTLVTNAYDVAIGGCKINWYMRYGLVPGSGPCEDPDAPAEGVHLQYSINNGASWTDFPGPNMTPLGPNSTTGPFITNNNGTGGYWQPENNATAQNASTLYHWHTYETTIPPIASTASTKFRFAQLSNSSAGWDAWGIDEVIIACPNPVFSILWSTGDTVFNPGLITLPPHADNLAYDTCFIIHIWDSLNPQGIYDTACVHVLPVPTSDFTYSDTSICDYETLSINYTGSAPSNAIYNWNVAGNTYNTSGPIDTIFPAGVYTTKLTVNQGGCVSNQTIKNVTVNPKPLLSFSPNIFDGCNPLTVTFNNYSSPANSSYFWNLGDGDTSYNDSPTHTYLNDGIYGVSLNATSPDGCYDTMSILNLIHVYPAPVASFMVDPAITTFENPNIQFTDLSTAASSWHWNFGDETTETIQNPYHTYAAVKGTYTVWLVVKSDKGCVDSTQMTVRVIVDKIEVPNIITPNGDGSNDKFVIKNIEEIESSTILIFNRWGKKVYESNNYDNTWEGDNLADGVYYYVIKYKTFLDEYEVKGSLTIMR